MRLSFNCIPGNLKPLPYIWILLIVEISTRKSKSINFAKFKRKRTPERISTPERFFPLQNTSERFRTVLKVFVNAFKPSLNAFFLGGLESKISSDHLAIKSQVTILAPEQRRWAGLDRGPGGRGGPGVRVRGPLRQVLRQRLDGVARSCQFQCGGLSLSHPKQSKGLQTTALQYRC